MKRQSFIAKTFRLATAFILLLSFCVSSVLPYSSEYFERKTVIADKVHSADKIQLASALKNSPIDRTVSETVRIVHISDFDLYKLFEGLIASRDILLNRIAGIQTAFNSIEPPQWHPSRVIALRRILI